MAEPEKPRCIVLTLEPGPRTGALVTFVEHLGCAAEAVTPDTAPTAGPAHMLVVLLGDDGTFPQALLHIATQLAPRMLAWPEGQPDAALRRAFGATHAPVIIAGSWLHWGFAFGQAGLVDLWMNL